MKQRTANNYTVDEKYMICLYEQALLAEGMDTPFSRYRIGELIGLQERGVNATCKLLLRTNFLKKSGEVDIYITPHGEALVKELIYKR